MAYVDFIIGSIPMKIKIKITLFHVKIYFKTADSTLIPK